MRNSSPCLEPPGIDIADPLPERVLSLIPAANSNTTIDLDDSEIEKEYGRHFIF